MSVTVALMDVSRIMEESSRFKGWLEVARVDEIPVGGMKHVEADGVEVLIANVAGKFYAIADRCGHMSVRLSSGNLRGNIVTCAAHGAQFDVITGKKQSEAKLGGPSQDLEKLPPSFLKMMEHMGKLMAEVKTYDQRVYETRIEGNIIKIKF
ncbi:MAG TPA: Rieske 2Fe-2S domain-containing protein [Candidatus Acidoferrum sp.]|nr:Rieske 2Fe-2S domain-containing protein [Candidatus Acidoferrum sp.]